MAGQSRKILVVDDTEATRYAIARTLKLSGYEVVEVENGTKTLEFLEQATPDLITLDIHLPDIIGFEVCRRIKANPKTAHIPVLQVSASYVTVKDRIHGLEGGADSYLTHPFEPAVLLATIKALLRSRELMDNLKLTEERFRVALKHAPILIYTTDMDLRYNWIYNLPEGLEASSFLGQTDAEVFSKEEALLLQEIKSEVLSTGVGKHVTEFLTLNGRRICYDMTIEPLRGSAGETKGLTVACIDVTARLKAEEEQRVARETAELANQAKTRFLSNMSHEIRTPLGIIQGFADLALDPATSSFDRSHYLQTIGRNARNLTKLIGEILDLAKVEAGRMDIEIEKFSISDLLLELVDTLSIQAKDKGLSIKTVFDGPFPAYARSDSTRVRQILMNLLGNAIKFTERGGIEVIASAVQTAEDQPVTIKVKIRDSGIGLAMDQQEKLFSRFSQADSSTTRRFGGTGLGLSLSKKLAQALGGDIMLESSTLHQGSVFTFTFNAGVLNRLDFADRFRQRESSEPSGPTRYNGELNGLKILLVEDSIDNQVLFARYLANMGAEVDIASDGLEALEVADTKPFEVVLMDVQMPNLDGHETTRALRARGFKTPIIALTAHALKEERDRALSQGFTDYLTKPLNPKILVETLSRFVK